MELNLFIYGCWNLKIENWFDFYLPIGDALFISHIFYFNIIIILVYWLCICLNAQGGEVVMVVLVMGDKIK